MRIVGGTVARGAIIRRSVAAAACGCSRTTDRSSSSPTTPRTPTRHCPPRTPLAAARHCPPRTKRWCRTPPPAPPDFNVNWQSIFWADPCAQCSYFNIDIGGRGCVRRWLPPSDRADKKLLNWQNFVHQRSRVKALVPLRSSCWRFDFDDIDGQHCT